MNELTDDLRRGFTPPAVCPTRTCPHPDQCRGECLQHLGLLADIEAENARIAKRHRDSASEGRSNG